MIERYQRCSSFQFYIKPQPLYECVPSCFVVPHSNSTSNHNATRMFRASSIVVPHSNSTSNHNMPAGETHPSKVVPHSNSTSNHNNGLSFISPVSLFLIPILHQTTTLRRFSFRLAQLFLIPILHQTTTQLVRELPSLTLFLIPILHQTTTKWAANLFSDVLFLIPILHQTTTSRMAVIHILHVTHMTPMHKTSCRTPGKLVGCNFVFQRAIYQKNSSC